MFELIVSLGQSECPRICYVGAARGDDPNRIAEFYELARRTSCDPYALKLFSMLTDEPDEYFRDADIIFIDGGATRNLIALMREWNAIDALKRAYQAGVVIVGASAGISMLFEWCISDSVRTRIAPVRGIGILPGTVCAHYDVSAERRDALESHLANEPCAVPAYGLSDGVAILFTDGEFEGAFSIKQTGVLHQFSVASGVIQHTTMTAMRVQDAVEAGGENIASLG